MAVDKKSPFQPTNAEGARDRAELTDDISRIVSFLDSKRSHSNERAQDLAQEIVQRRDEENGRLSESANRDLADQLDELAQSLPERSNQSAGSGNPVLAVRYHSFCREMDLLLESFQARVNGAKPVQH